MFSRLLKGVKGFLSSVRKHNKKPVALDLNKAFSSGGLSSANKSVSVKRPTASQVAKKYTFSKPKPLDVQKAFKSGGLKRSGVGANTTLDKSGVTLADNINSGALSIKKKQDEFDLIREEFKQKAIKNTEAISGDASYGVVDNVADFLTFGDTRRKRSANAWAAKQQESLFGKIDDYDSRKEKFESDLAKRRAKIEASRETLNPTDFNKLVDDYIQWEKDEVYGLNYQAASLMGLIEGYGIKGSSKIDSWAGAFGRGAKWAGNKATNNAVWRYTLGEGSKNVPSLVTLPGRLVNTVNNAARDDERKIYRDDLTTINRKEEGLNAWQASYKQRAFNNDYWVDIPYSRQAALKMLKQNPYEAPLERLSDEQLRKKWDDWNRFNRRKDTLRELTTDPANFLGVFGKANKLSKTTKAGNKIRNLSKIDKASEWSRLAKTRLTNTKAGKWLTSEYKAPEELLNDALDVARTKTDKAQQELLPKLVKARKELDDIGIDTSVFDDLGKLDDFTAGVIQRSVNGKLARRDALLLAGRKPQRLRIEAIIAKIEDFSEQMRIADNVENTRFGRSVKGKFYAPTPVREVDGTLDKYNFRAFKKGNSKKTARELRQGFIDRYFVSKLDDVTDAKKVSKSDEISKIGKEYDELMDEAYSGVQDARSKLNSRGNKIRKTLSAPTNVWKKSVLKYRPAWTVNNVGYNTQAAVLAGGAEALVEQAKLLNPKYYKKVLDEVPESVKSNLAKELGSKGKLNSFYSRTENIARVGAYRAAVKKGLSPEEALKRVNKYLFDYKITNAERPLKAIMPFYTFQKNLAKATAQMPFDRPLAARFYNELDQFQQNQFSADFESTRDELRGLGFTDDEIDVIKQDLTKYYKGKLKVGDKYYNTPFNGFSEKAVSSLGINPYLAAWSEFATSTDSFGNEVSGEDASLRARIITKFPQADMLNEATKPSRTERWISEAGSSGFGLSKESQGDDNTKSNYIPSLDPDRNLKDKALSFLGKPKATTFDKNKLVERKRLEKLKNEYFAIDSGLSFEERQAAQQAVFDKYGITADQFYNSELAKYDTESTKRTKDLKQEAREKNSQLWAEYRQQPKGTRSAWAAAKIHELNESGYFDDNPYLTSFDWVNKETFEKAARKRGYDIAKKTGDWTEYNKAIGRKNSLRKPFTKQSRRRPSQKKLAYDKAKKTGDWTEYYQTYGDNRSEEAKFWSKYVEASTEQRRQMLKDNPQFATRGDWTNEQWDAWKAKNKKSARESLSSLDGFKESVAKHRKANKWDALIFNSRARRKKRVLTKLR